MSFYQFLVSLIRLSVGLEELQQTHFILFG